MYRFGFYISIVFLTFTVGSSITLTFVWRKEKQSTIANTQEPKQGIDLQSGSFSSQTVEIAVSKNDNCEEWIDEIDYQPIIKKWMRGENLKNVPYCSKNGREAKSFNHSNVTPTLIDLNKDGKKELALQSGCSVTGNCEMDIFERIGRGYRKIFSAVHGVQVFGLNKSMNKRYQDIWARMHGGWNSGDMIFYRFDGKRYKPKSCFDYEYKERKNSDGNAKVDDSPTLTSSKCSNFF